MVLINISENESSTLYVEYYNTEIIPTKNKLPQLPEEIVHKIMLMAFSIRPHPASALIKYEKDVIKDNILEMMKPDVKYYQKFLSAILGDTKRDFINWWIDKMVYKVRYRICAEEIINEVRGDIEAERIENQW